MGTLDSTARRDDRIDWRQAHEALSRLARARAAADAEEGRWLLAALRAAVHVHLGYASFTEYVERLFGYKPRSTQEKLRVAEALESLPAIADALSTGELNWSAARELTRAAVADNEREWLDFARGKTVRQLEQMLTGKQPGDSPRSPSNPAAQRHVLRFEVAADTLALFRDALNELRRRAGTTLDDDAALLELARTVLGGPRDEGRASYQVVLSVCPECANGRQQTAGGLVTLDPDVIRMAHCDAQHVGHIEAHCLRPANDLDADDHSPAEPTVANDAHVGASVTPASTPNLPRAHQDVPPALRRTVRLRDERRCQVPGCTNSTWLDLHHLELRSDGGAHSLDNLINLCGPHHRAAHGGALTIDRRENGNLRVRHADGTQYGDRVDPHALDTRAKVFSALRNLGFREAQVRTALDSLRREATPMPVSFDALLRAALERLRPVTARR